jgi:phosphoglycerol transferase MdoB-like AlkP superfamily enzyme
MFFRFLVSAFLSFVAASFVLKSTLLIWAADTFERLPLADQLYALTWGLRFDLAIAGLVLIPVAVGTYLTIRIFKKASLSYAWFVFPIVLLSGIQLGDLIYFDNTGHHVSYEIKELINESTGLLDTALAGYPAPIFGLIVFSFVAFFLARHRYPLVQQATLYNLELPLVLCLFFCLLFMRGSVRDIPLHTSYAFHVGSPQMATIALTPSFSIAYSLRTQTETLSPIYLSAPKPDAAFLNNNLALFLQEKQGNYIAPQRKMNVVLFLLESWPAELMHSYNPKAQVATPELDELTHRGLSTEGMMASGTRTVIGVFSSLCSYPSPLDSQIPKTKLQFLEYRCLPELMKDEGWQVSMFQGMFDGLTGQLAKKIGVETSYGKLDMPPPTVELNGWGYQDPDIYKFVLEKAKQETKPFFYIINNMTTHDAHAKQLPSDEPWVFGKSNKDEMQKSVLHYADRALGEFIRNYESSQLGPTLFVFTADHTAGQRSGNFGRYWIPFSMYATDGSIPKSRKVGVGSQIDVGPTILDALHGQAPWFAGQSLLKQGPSVGGGYFSSGNVGWIRGDIATEFPIKDPSLTTCYQWRQDLTYKTPIACSDEAKKTAAFSYAFTWYSQELLFAGKTKQFGQP